MDMALCYLSMSNRHYAFFVVMFLCVHTMTCTVTASFRPCQIFVTFYSKMFIDLVNFCFHYLLEWRCCWTKYAESESLSVCLRKWMTNLHILCTLSGPVLLFWTIFCWLEHDWIHFSQSVLLSSLASKSKLLQWHIHVRPSILAGYIGPNSQQSYNHAGSNPADATTTRQLSGWKISTARFLVRKIPFQRNHHNRVVIPSQRASAPWKHELSGVSWGLG